MSDGSVTLKEYFTQLRIDDKEAVRAALAAAEKAVERAEVNAEKWRQNANEWRQSMLDRETKFSTRSDVEYLKEQVADIRNVLSARGGTVTGGKAVKDESRANIALAMGVVGSLVGLVGFILALQR